MTSARVLNTTVASFLLDRHPLLALYQPYLQGAFLVLSFQTLAEMRFGSLKAQWGEQRKQQLAQFFHSFHVVVYSHELGQLWAEIMYDARKAGRRLEAGDAWIAATARYLNAPLVTHDQDFSEDACPSITVWRNS